MTRLAAAEEQQKFKKIGLLLGCLGFVFLGFFILIIVAIIWAIFNH